MLANHQGFSHNMGGMQPMQMNGMGMGSPYGHHLDLMELHKHHGLTHMDKAERKAERKEARTDARVSARKARREQKKAAAPPNKPAAAPKAQGKHVEEDIVFGGSPYGYGAYGMAPGSYDPWAAPFQPEVELTRYPSDGLGWAAAWDALNIPAAGAPAAVAPEFFGEVPAVGYGYGAVDTLAYDVALDSAYPYSDVYGYGAWGAPVAEPYLDLPDYTWIS